VMWVVMLMAMGLELVMYAERFLREEYRAKTLPALFLLPRRMQEIVYAKIVGNVLALGPALIWFIVGAVLWSEHIPEFLEALTRKPEIFFAICLIAAEVVAALHLVAFLSLVVKWGAVPLAIGVGVLTNMCCIGFVTEVNGVISGPNEFEVVAALFIAFMALISLILHIAIATRLEKLAAE